MKLALDFTTFCLLLTAAFAPLAASAASTPNAAGDAIMMQKMMIWVNDVMTGIEAKSTDLSKAKPEDIQTFVAQFAEMNNIPLKTVYMVSDMMAKLCKNAGGGPAPMAYERVASAAPAGLMAQGKSVVDGMFAAEKPAGMGMDGMDMKVGEMMPEETAMMKEKGESVELMGMESLTSQTAQEVSAAVKSSAAAATSILTTLSIMALFLI
ncbi:hypothetical protein BJ741DRAFT_705138 [Chytriomyces cf. hyalinus JEL632]|nr:hypothetical protein BJ741DRAFT_705138 [Chytriomyces cf. hyalinus JEL632]